MEQGVLKNVRLAHSLPYGTGRIVSMKRARPANPATSETVQEIARADRSGGRGMASRRFISSKIIAGVCLGFGDGCPKFEISDCRSESAGTKC